MAAAKALSRRAGAAGCRARAAAVERDHEQHPPGQRHKGRNGLLREQRTVAVDHDQPLRPRLHKERSQFRHQRRQQQRLPAHEAELRRRFRLLQEGRQERQQNRAARRPRPLLLRM
jgi:hypothetical protein